MAERYLIETSAVIKYLNNSFPLRAIEFLDSLLDNEINISFITKIELLVWNPPSPSDLIIFADFVKEANIIFADTNIANEAIEIRKQTKIKLPDALIASTAFCNHLTLIGDNDKDFNKVVAMEIGFEYLNPNTII